MSHRGSLLCLPDAMWAWPVTKPEDIDEDSLAVSSRPPYNRHADCWHGTAVWVSPRGLREALRAAGIVLEPMQTGPAIRTYNIMIARGGASRRR